MSPSTRPAACAAPKQPVRHGVLCVQGGPRQLGSVGEGGEARVDRVRGGTEARPVGHHPVVDRPPRPVGGAEVHRLMADLGGLGAVRVRVGALVGAPLVRQLPAPLAVEAGDFGRRRDHSRFVDHRFRGRRHLDRRIVGLQGAGLGPVAGFRVHGRLAVDQRDAVRRDRRSTVGGLAATVGSLAAADCRGDACRPLLLRPGHVRVGARVAGGIRSFRHRRQAAAAQQQTRQDEEQHRAGQPVASTATKPRSRPEEGSTHRIVVRHGAGSPCGPPTESPGSSRSLALRRIPRRPER